MFLRLLILLILIGIGVSRVTCAAITVTDLYEVGQGSIALTTEGRTQRPAPTLIVANQYIYSPYGIQKNLNHPIMLPSPHRGRGAGGEGGFQSLFNRTRKPLNIIHNQLGYTGQAQDPSTNLMMLGGFRNYAPGIGRFIQPDTYNSFSKTSITNAFAYASGNTMLYTDPTGHWSQPDTLLNFAMLAVGGVFSFAAVAGAVGDGLGMITTIATRAARNVAGIGGLFGLASVATGAVAATQHTRGAASNLNGISSLLGIGSAIFGGIEGGMQAANKFLSPGVRALAGFSGLVSAAGAGNMIAGMTLHSQQSQIITRDVGYGLMAIGLLPLFVGSTRAVVDIAENTGSPPETYLWLGNDSLFKTEGKEIEMHLLSQEVKGNLPIGEDSSQYVNQMTSSQRAIIGYLFRHPGYQIKLAVDQSSSENTSTLVGQFTTLMERLGYSKGGGNLKWYQLNGKRMRVGDHQYYIHQSQLKVTGAAEKRALFIQAE